MKNMVNAIASKAAIRGDASQSLAMPKISAAQAPAINPTIGKTQMQSAIRTPASVHDGTEGFG